MSTKYGTFASSGTQQVLGLSPRRIYTILNLGKNAAHSADANDIYFSLGTDDAADGSVGENKIILPANVSIVIGPAQFALNYKASTGGPTFIVSSEHASQAEMAVNGVS